MLDYAPNGVRYWPVDHLRRLFEDQCARDSRKPLEYLQTVVAPDVNPEVSGAAWVNTCRSAGYEWCS